jgi:nickel-dependent lactate racemase
LNRLVWEGRHDLVLSIGQVVPHEVIGMANYNKNLLIGTGGAESINKSHFIGAVYGLERLMGRADNPVRKLLNYASEIFLSNLPIVYVHTVIALDENGKLVTRGLFIGDDEEVFHLAARLSLKVNFTLMKQPLDKVIVYLDPSEYKSTWLGNKSIYRTRMALADKAELIILAPGVKEFGEDPEINRLIRKYGYFGTQDILKEVVKDSELKNNLSAAAHLIHGSTEERFSVTYCTKELSKREIESVNYRYAPLDDMISRYDPGKLHEGINRLPDGEMIYYISNPAIGLWAEEKRFTSNN